MTVMARARRLWRVGKQVVLDKAPPPDPADAAAWEDAVALWAQLFEPFSPMVEDADVLEVGCGDGRLLAALVGSGGARSALGLDHHAWWRGRGDGVAWAFGDASRVDLHADPDRLESLDEGQFDLILARELDAFMPLDGIEARLERLYGVLRPGGEMIARLRCGAPGADPRGPGYGFMTPTAWTALMLAAGFEIAAVRRVWRDPVDHRDAAAWLPEASDDERLTSEIHLHLLRPWESWDLDALKDFGDRRRGRPGAR